MEKEKNILDDYAYLFHQGTYYQCYEFLGCHLQEDGGAIFRTWAPNAKAVSVVGDFNDWQPSASAMTKITKSGIWEVFVPNAKIFDKYKLHITSKNKSFLKSDPYAFMNETSGRTASIVYDYKGYPWSDENYLKYRKNKNIYSSPVNIYEVNFASWKRQEDGSYYTYKMIADELIPYVVSMNYTHIEVMPINEYPFDGSWGYQVTGYFSVTSRFGTPKDFMYFVDECHKAGLGVIVDWVPAHFPKDEEGLIDFDGSHLYENQGWDRKEHKTWGTRIFDYGREEVQSFLISSAMMLLKEYHVDGLRVDAVASMLYLDYDRKPDEWIPNEFGDNKNIEAIAFLQKLNAAVFKDCNDVMMIAEESTSWPLVSKPVDIGGLGFNFKWNIGWMNDSLEYMQSDPFFRKGVHDKLTFSLFYAFSENFILPISHDEVVHGKKSLLNKMFGEYEDKFSSMRAYLAYMMAHPGKKLTFMGTEFAQFIEWDHTKGLDFLLLDYPLHQNMHNFVKEINLLYLANKPLYEVDFDWSGYTWLVADDNVQNVVSFARYDKSGNEIIFVANFSTIAREDYRIGVNNPGVYEEVLSTDNEKFGGNNVLNKNVLAKEIYSHGKKYSISLTLPPLTAMFIKNTSNIKLD